MGRPPCCDKVGIKKGPWTPEEDIILVSYIQEHGPGNWRSVPTNTGLLRCSKSCRLRWTNYLRPGIKRGNFTPHEEGMIIHLQALLGNKWAAIASYLPQRTDNDIKNYWNTHLKKKLKKLQSASSIDHPQDQSAESSSNTTTFDQFESSKSFRGLGMAAMSCASESTLLGILNNKASTSTYASSTENISRLLQGWMRSSSSPNTCKEEPPHHQNSDATNAKAMASSSTPQFLPNLKSEHQQNQSSGELGHEEFDSAILSFDNLKNVCSSWDDDDDDDHKSNLNNNDGDNGEEKQKQRSENAQPPLSFLEKWLFEESASGPVEELMELSPVF